jgi:hypothetical protein
MAKSFSETRSFAVWNGYEEIPSPELRNRYIRPRQDELYPPYPPLFTILALPFYRCLGFFGLFAMNSLAFAGVVALCFALARKLFNDTDLALNACLILILGTFAWEYSQAAWPHIFGLLFVMAALYLSVAAYAAGGHIGDTDSRHSGDALSRIAHTNRTAVMLAVASGFIGAAGIAVRLDAVLVFPALILPFLFSKTPRLWEALGVLAGAVPPVILLSAANYVKFGDLNPLSIGEGPGAQPMPGWLLVAALAFLCISWTFSRPRFLGLHARDKAIAWAAIGVGAILTLALTPEVVELICRVLRDGYVCLVDVRTLPAESVVALRSSGGGVVYIGAHKKALLQSLPYLPLLMLPVLHLFNRGKHFRALAILFLPVIAVIGFYVYSFPFHDMGGLCLNTRYFIPSLPFMAILCAYGIRDLKERWRGPGESGSEEWGGTFCKKSLPKPLPKNSCKLEGWLRTVLLPKVRTGTEAACERNFETGGVAAVVIVLVSSFTAVLFFLFSKRWFVGLDALEFPLLTLPLCMAALLSALLVCGLVVKSPGVRFARKGAWLMVIVTMTWAGLVALWYDYPAHRFVRVVHTAYGKKLLENISADSIVFADNKTFSVAMSAIEKPRVRVAFPPQDGFADFIMLLDFQLKRGRRAFALFHNPLWAELQGSLLVSYRVTPLVVLGDFTLGEIAVPASGLQQ